MDKYIGKRLEGRYEIQELIGIGGMANVYKAYDSIDQRTVAVKILRDEYLGNTEFLRRFKNESKAIAVLSHPNIVRVFDVSFTGRIHSIVMEYIDGITLKEYIEQQGMLDWKEAIHFTLQILRALQHAHDKGIVHRDIKPQNIMLLQNGAIKVTDFGIARFARSEVKTITDRAIGSVHYISPEQAMGDATDAKSDIYSVGVMLFEMLTGTLPFEAENAVSVAIKQIQSQAVRPTTINPAIPTGLEDITVRAMQKDASQRYQSAAEMIADIERFKQDPSINFAYKYLDADSVPVQNKKYQKAIVKGREAGSNPKRRKRTPYIPILTGVTFAFVLASIGFIGLMVYLNNPFADVDDIPVPDLVGMKLDTAKRQHSNVDIVVEETVPNGEYGVDVIFEQSPKPGRQMKENGTVTVYVSSGQMVVTLPNFTGRDPDEVASKLVELGLTYELASVFSSEVPSGSVVYTEPSRDSEVSTGTLVRVYVSLGPEITYANVPDLIGMSLDDATRYLELSKLRAGNVSYEDSDMPEDTVIGQDPAPGSVREEDSTVNLVVSKGNQLETVTLALTVPMPDIDREVTLSAELDGEVVETELNMVPSEIGEWKPHFRGTAEDTEAQIRIYIDGVIYKEYVLNFETKRFVETEYSKTIEFGVGG